MVSKVMLLPQQNLGIVMLTNQETGFAFDSVIYKIIDGYGPKYHQPLTLLTFLTRFRNYPPTDWLQKFVGIAQKNQEACKQVDPQNTTQSRKS